MWLDLLRAPSSELSVSQAIAASLLDAVAPVPVAELREHPVLRQYRLPVPSEPADESGFPACWRGCGP